MRWTMPVFALALAIALGALGPLHGQPGRAPAGLGGFSLGGFSLFSSAGASTLPRLPACQQAVAPQGNQALLGAASLRGWAEGPTVQAWRHFVAWSKQGLRPATPCPARTRQG